LVSSRQKLQLKAGLPGDAPSFPPVIINSAPFRNRHRKSLIQAHPFRLTGKQPPHMPSTNHTAAGLALAFLAVLTLADGVNNNALSLLLGRADSQPGLWNRGTTNLILGGVSGAFAFFPPVGKCRADFSKT
jgi:hypothetical protein